ncbi:hypothetical protein E1293_15170 [Actinomadura darangshiensis]|uniref:SH3 domain-containing protein n=1 Tax=Actinomadura darangshiensis TaxID=705336 RepID=A0A4R5BCG4_9ACTN|nr:SH3 domain-containing protein [Actinomadura darangshiensis]TDD83235.1 hypothetical protein E1293_15170 [Actinomadura darangshiensis]
MHVGMKLGVGLTATALIGSTLSLGAVAGAAQPPPKPGHDQSGPAKPRPPQDEEGHGPGAIVVGPEGAAAAMNRLLVRDEQRTRWCHGRVLPADGLNVRTGPGTGYEKVGALEHGTSVTTDWDTIQRRNGYLWVRMSHHHWIADYKLGNGNGKWYIKYDNC